ncbi:hypothetical protein YC2023_119727 [Brassica napus]
MKQDVTQTQTQRRCVFNTLLNEQGNRENVEIQIADYIYHAFDQVSVLIFKKWLFSFKIDKWKLDQEKAWLFSLS